MIRAVMGSKNGSAPLLVLGITAENVTRLVAGEPILIGDEDMAAMGFPGMSIAICYGKTHDDILAELNP